MMDLFNDDDSDNEVTFKSNSEYAKKYNILRRKEELLKLKNKYGDTGFAALAEESSTSEDEEDEVVFTEEFEKDFFKTLSCLKNKDPRIYDKDVRFFGEAANPKASTSKEASKEKPITIRDYNRKIITEKDGKYEDDDDEGNQDGTINHEPSYVEEQKQIKKMFSKVVNADDDSDGEDKQIGGLFSKKQKTTQEEEEEEKGYREWLSGQVNHLDNDSEETDLKPLKDYWCDPKLDEGEAFLRDYFLKQRFKEESTDDRIPSYDEIVNDNEEDLSEDEKLVGQQTAFEHKYNFRFEEPDQEFIKRYPRTLEHSMRRKDDRRTKKRNEIKERKAEEKVRKKEELAQLKAMKLKEIQEKIGQLKEITGNEQLAFNDEDIEGEFDPDAHDRRMKQLFDEEYYKDEADDEKPEFPDLDKDLNLGKWDQWGCKIADDAEPNCEDEGFNMDCDYDPSQSKNADVVESKRKRKNKKKQLAEVLDKKKPELSAVKVGQDVAKDLDEYYKLDCEDVIGDMACRFKYRQVPALDYGLTTEEILLADDQELNRWYPLKKTLMYLPDHKQLNDQKIFESKARNLKLKMKILPSLFKPRKEEDDIDANSIPGVSQETVSKKKRKRMKKDKNKIAIDREDTSVDIGESRKIKHSESEKVVDDSIIKLHENNTRDVENSENVEKEDASIPKKKRKRNKNKQDFIQCNVINSNETEENLSMNKEESDGIKTGNEEGSPPKKKRKHNKNKQDVVQPIKVDINEYETNHSSNKEKYNDEMKAGNEEEPSPKKKRKRNKNKPENGVDDQSNKHVDSEKVIKNKEDGFEAVNGESSVEKKKRNKNKKESDNPSETNEAQDSKDKKNSQIHEIRQDELPVKKKRNRNKNKGNDYQNTNIFNKHSGDRNMKIGFVKEKKQNDALSNISDERLKAYGLNPKKYRDFMKFKKY